MLIRISTLRELTRMRITKLLSRLARIEMGFRREKKDFFIFPP
jgi:hypothetical protein